MKGLITKRETDVFTMFQFSAGATIVNFFSSGAVLFTLTLADGSPAVSSSNRSGCHRDVRLQICRGQPVPGLPHMSEGKQTDNNTQQTLNTQEQAK